MAMVAALSRQPNRIPVSSSIDRVSETEIQLHQFNRFSRMELIWPSAVKSSPEGHHQRNVF
jgi:hypothetical protein